MCMKCVFLQHLEMCKQCRTHILDCEKRKFEMIPENAEEFERGMCAEAILILKLGTAERILFIV